MSDAAELKRFALFADLDESEREELAALCEERDLSLGETLFDEGEEADSLLLVVTGRIELSSRRTAERLSLAPGDSLGGLSLFAVGNRAVSVTGAEPSALRLLRREDFLRFAEDHPRAAFRIAAALASDAATHARAAFASVDPSERRD